MTTALPRRPDSRLIAPLLLSGARPELSKVSVYEPRLADEAAGAAGRHELGALLVIPAEPSSTASSDRGAGERGADLETAVVAQTDIQEHGWGSEALDGISALATQPASATTS